MSKLHERLLKHKHMSLEEKKACRCDMCKRLNVNKSVYKAGFDGQPKNNYEQKSDVSVQKIGIPTKL